jgi:hypothetical protein
MRLLSVGEEGRFSLKEYTGKNVPPYAILSHTWGQDDEEATFKDLAEGKGEEKPGFQKLVFCARQAEKDGLRFFWVDTCCIDKSSSAELSEAINSMFRWYHEAVKCYVHLSDVSVNSPTTNDIPPRQAWEQSFHNSRWFTRGWTLQELLAPRSVEFFSAEGQRLGSKGALTQDIVKITKIPARALQGTPLNQFSIGERMSWAERRKTTREEDIAYSLLGIFDVFILPIYGERRERAFTRLRRKIKEEHGEEQFAEEQGSVESSWEKLMDARRFSGDCLNCGSQYHWEAKCRQACGKCITFDDTKSVRELTKSGFSTAHKASSCRNRVHCFKC